jgi:hypothetical protein
MRIGSVKPGTQSEQLTSLLVLLGGIVAPFSMSTTCPLHWFPPPVFVGFVSAQQGVLVELAGVPGLSQ